MERAFYDNKLFQIELRCKVRWDLQKLMVHMDV